MILQRIAVITVCRNALPELIRTTDSINQQSYKQIQHIIIDGASTDGTSAWLIENKNKFSIAISEPDKGIYDAMNKGVNRCENADWVIFLNAGDCFPTLETVHAISEKLATYDTDFLFGSVAIRQKQYCDAPRIYPPRKIGFSDMPGCHQSCVVRSTLLKALQFDTTYKVAADFELWLRAQTRHHATTRTVKTTFSEIAPEGFSARNEKTLRSDYFRAIKKHVGLTWAWYWIAKRLTRTTVISIFKRTGI